MATTYCPSCEAQVAKGDRRCPACEGARPVEGWPSDPLLGRRFLDQYNVVRRLGAGGFGVVYLAENLEFGAKRALKVLDARHVHNDNILRRFKREAKALYRLQSPYTVRVERWGRSDEGFYYLVMEFAEGETLRQILKRRGRLDERRALAIARQTAVALSDAHALGILHRDLKPENLVIRRHPHEGDRVAVLDFGISKILADKTTNRGSGLVGTPSYMAPETFRPSLGPHDIRGDLWSLGVILYEMLTGHLPRQPWAEGSDAERGSSAELIRTAFQVANLEPEELLTALDELDVHSQTRSILSLLLQSRPADRFASPAKLLAQLDAHPLWATSARRTSHPDTPVPGSDADPPASDGPSDTHEVGLADTLVSPADGPRQPSFDDGDTFVFEDEPPEHLRISRSSGAGDGDERRGPSIWTVLLAIAVLGAIALAMEFAGDWLGTGSRADAGSTDAGLVQRDVGEPSLPATRGPTLDGVTLHLVAGGPFEMGIDEPASLAPSHNVVIDPFYIDAAEVTAGRWLDCVERGHCRADQASSTAERAGCRALDGSANDNVAPMSCVSWDGARAYCATYGRRLPTEAEWEGAARAELAGPVALADGPREWVNDWYDADYYDVSPTFDPRGSLFGTEKVVRGPTAAAPRLGDRDKAPPETRSSEIGFRCVADP